MMHVDNFIDFGTKDKYENENYARWILNHFRLSASLKYIFDEFMKDHKLFCEYKGEKFRVIGASRLGDIWLTSDFNKTHGYKHRVSIEDCKNWSKK